MQLLSYPLHWLKQGKKYAKPAVAMLVIAAMLLSVMPMTAFAAAAPSVLVGGIGTHSYTYAVNTENAAQINEQALKNYDCAGLNGQNGMQWIESRKALCVAVAVAVSKSTPEYIAPANVTATYGDTLSDVNISAWAAVGVSTSPKFVTQVPVISGTRW